MKIYYLGELLSDGWKCTSHTIRELIGHNDKTMKLDDVITLEKTLKNKEDTNLFTTDDEVELTRLNLTKIRYVIGTIMFARWGLEKPEAFAHPPTLESYINSPHKTNNVEYKTYEEYLRYLETMDIFTKYEINLINKEFYNEEDNIK